MKGTMIARFFLCALLGWATAQAGPVEVAEQAREWRIAHEQVIVDRFAELLRIPTWPATVRTSAAMQTI